MKYLILCCMLVSSVCLAEVNEVQCMAQNIYFEARGEPEAGKFLVGFVTMNRVRDSRWPSTVCKVIRQTNQFSWYSDGKSDWPKEMLAWKEAKEIAQIVYNSKLTDTMQYGLYFKATYAKSRFFNRLTKLHKVGKHEFYN